MAKGIWIPIEVLHNKDLTMQEKLILMEITQLEMLDKGCIASNRHFAELLDISTKSASNTVSGLVKKGYIKTVIKDGSRNHQREIFTIHPTMDTHPQIMDTPSTKDGETKENKTINNTASEDTARLKVEFVSIWDDYRDTIIKPQGRRGGSKATAEAKYIKLRGKYSSEQLIHVVSIFKQLKIGHKDLERVFNDDNVKQALEEPQTQASDVFEKVVM